MKAEIILGIYTHLQKHGKITLNYIANKWEISQRTAFRYMNELSCILPITSKKGTDGGYFLCN